MALLHKGVLQEALVYAPERNDVYMASRGKGALLNDRRIRVSKPHRIEPLPDRIPASLLSIKA